MITLTLNFMITLTLNFELYDYSYFELYDYYELYVMSCLATYRIIACHANHKVQSSNLKVQS